MDIQQLKVFVTVAQQGSITRASDILCRSQPSVSAQIKGVEEELGLSLFERTSRGMSVTQNGERLLGEATQLLDRHKKFLQEATRLKGSVVGKFSLGAGRHSGNNFVSSFLLLISERFPELEIELKHLTSAQVIEGLRNETLDMGFFTENEDNMADMALTEVSRFSINLAAPIGLIPVGSPLDWHQMADMVWIISSQDGCCRRWAEELMKQYDIQPKSVISVDDETITRALVASGAGIGLVHINTNDGLHPPDDVTLLHEVRKTARIMSGVLFTRANDPAINAVNALFADLLQSGTGTDASVSQLFA